MSSPVFSLRSGASNGHIDARSSGSGSLDLIDANGNVIKPLEKGPAPSPEALVARGDVCVKGSWTDTTDEFWTTSPYTQVVSTVHNGGSTGTDVEITQSRSSSWSTTIEANVGFADIFSMGVGFSRTETEEISNGETATYEVPAGQRGYVAWTGFVLCKEGKLEVT